MRRPSIVRRRHGTGGGAGQSGLPDISEILGVDEYLNRRCGARPEKPKDQSDSLSFRSRVVVPRLPPVRRPRSDSRDRHTCSCPRAPNGSRCMSASSSRRVFLIGYARSTARSAGVAIHVNRTRFLRPEQCCPGSAGRACRAANAQRRAAAPLRD